MIIKLLKSQKPFIAVLLPVILIIFWFNLFYNYSSIEFLNNENSMPLFNWISGYLETSKILSLSIILVLLILQSIYINRINSKHILIEGRSNVLIVIYILLVSCINFSFGIHPLYFASVFIIIAIDSLLKTYKQNIAVSQIFISGISIGIGSLFCFEVIFLLIPVWFGLSILRSFNLREWLIVNIGFLLPHVFSFAYFFIIENDLSYADRLVHYIAIPTSFILEITWKLYLLIASIVILSLSVIIHYLKENYGYKISSIKYFNVLLVFLLINCILMIIFQDVSFFILTAIPLTFLTSNYILAKKYTVFKDILIIIVIITLILINISIFFE